MSLFRTPIFLYSHILNCETWILTIAGRVRVESTIERSTK